MSNHPAGRPMRPWLALPLVVALLLLTFITVLPRPASAEVPDTAAADQALAWLRTQQQPDGSFSAFGGPGDPGTSADVAFAFAAAGIDSHSVRVFGGIDLVTYLESTGPAISSDPGLSAKVALALHAAGADPRDAAGTDLVEAIIAGYDAETHRFGQSFYGHTLAVLALSTLGVRLELDAVVTLFNSQTPDGSWGFNGDTTPGTGDSNTTALVIQTLVRIGGERNLIWDGLDYLRSLQDDAGAIAYDRNFSPLAGDANSTALAIQAAVAAGEDTAGLPKGELLAALAAFQNPSGAFQFQPAFPDDSLLATAQAIPALLLEPYPIEPVVVENPLHDAAQPTSPFPGCSYHEPTLHNVCGVFADYWELHGGLEIFGYPLTEEVDYLGQRVQYFERARFEWHPENAGSEWEVLLTRLAADEVERAYPERTGRAAALDGCSYHDITGHNVCEPFAWIWSQMGGLPVFGYPLTEAFDENGITVQYFERARFEWQPGVWFDRLDVLFGLVGAEALARELAR